MLNLLHDKWSFDILIHVFTSANNFLFLSNGCLKTDAYTWKWNSRSYRWGFAEDVSGDGTVLCVDKVTVNQRMEV
jgi:hypothetical protein